eukprot:1158694-Pelagomonas_calceolata.AAC.6
MLVYIPVVQAPPPPKVVWVQLLPIKLPGREEVHPGQLAAESAAGSVGKAVRAGDACLEEVAAIAPEEFVDPTATAPSRGKGGRGRGRDSGTQEQATAQSQRGRGE